MEFDFCENVCLFFFCDDHQSKTTLCSLIFVQSCRPLIFPANYNNKLLSNIAIVLELEGLSIVQDVCFLRLPNRLTFSCTMDSNAH